MSFFSFRQDQVGAIRKAAAFLNKTLTEEDIQKLADHLSFSKMKNNPAVNLEPLMAKKEGPDFMKNSELKFIRKGEVSRERKRKE